jgi:hypothetical protein
MVKRWIQRAIVRPGTLHKNLGIPKGEKIPMNLLNKIISAKAGDTIKNPTKKGNRRIKVTRKLERKAILARNLKRI